MNVTLICSPAHFLLIARRSARRVNREWRIFIEALSGWSLFDFLMKDFGARAKAGTLAPDLEILRHRFLSSAMLLFIWPHWFGEKNSSASPPLERVLSIDAPISLGRQNEGLFLERGEFAFIAQNLIKLLSIV